MRFPTTTERTCRTGRAIERARRGEGPARRRADAIRAGGPTWQELERRICLAASFAPTMSLGFGFGMPIAVVAADFNNDGNPDIAMLGDGGGNFGIRLGNGLGGFGAPIPSGVPSAGPRAAMVPLDFDGDGDTDLAFGSTGTGGVHVVLNNGSGNMVPGPFGSAGPVRSVATGDLNNDGRPDLVTGGNGGAVTVLLNMGGTHLSSGTTHPTGGTFQEGVAIGKLDGDPFPDIAIVNSGGGSQVVVLRGLSGGGFTGPNVLPPVAFGEVPAGVAIGNLNGDPLGDVLAITGSGTLNAYVNAGGGVFNGPNPSPGAGGSGGGGGGGGGGSFSRPLVAADFDNDGLLDAVTTSQAANHVAVFPGVAGGTFGTPTLFPSGGSEPVSLSAADFNGDGLMDLVTANRSGGNAGVLLNTTAPPPATLAVNDVTLAEGDVGTVTATFTVSLTGTILAPVTVDVATADGTASSAPGGDYDAAGPTTLTFNPGDTTKPFAVTIHGDALVEANETFFVNLSNQTETAVLGDSQGTGTITNDDVPSISINDVAVAEGNGPGDVIATFTVSLSQSSPDPVSVDFATANGSAVEPGDYAASSGTVTFAPGDIARTIDVAIHGDTNAELDETYLVNLSAATNAIITDAQGEGTILDDDDALGSASFAPAFSVGAGGGSPLAVVAADFDNDGNDDIALLNDGGPGLVVRLGDGSGNFGPPVTSPVPFSPGPRASLVALHFNNDGLLDLAFGSTGGGGVHVRLNDGMGMFSGGPSVGGTGPIRSLAAGDLNGDNRPDLVTGGNFNAVSVLLNEGGTNLGSAQGHPAGGTAHEGVAIGHIDEDSFADIAVANGSGSVTVLFGTVGGGFNMTPLPPVNGGQPAGIAIGDFDGDLLTDVAAITFFGTVNAYRNAGARSFDMPMSTGGAGGGGGGGGGSNARPLVAADFDNDGKLDLVTTSEAANAVRLFPGVGNGSFAAPTSFHSGGGQPRWLSAADFNSDGRLDLVTANWAGGNAGVLLNNTAPPPATLAVNDVTLAEGDAGTVNATFTVSLTGTILAPVTVQVATADGTASSAPGGDYDAAGPTTLTFNPGDTTKPFAVTIHGDALVEADETFLVNLTNPTGTATVADNQGVGTILNDDAPSISIDDVAVAEGDAGTVTATFTVSLTGTIFAPVTVDVATADGTASSAPGGDYDAAGPTMLTFNPGDTTKPFAVTIHGDALAEANETYVVNLSNATNAAIADAQGLGTILNDDAPPVTQTVQFASATHSVNEDGGAVTVTVTRTGGSLAGNVRVGYVATPGTATAGSDFKPVSGNVRFAAGQASATFDVPVKNDNAAEPDETVNLSLSNPSGGAALGTPASAVLTIVDDEPPIEAKGLRLIADNARHFSGVVATFQDVDFPAPPASFTATINWGDGATSAGVVSFNAGADEWEVRGSHTYAAKGRYTVTMLVTDANGATGTAESKMKA